ncbi:MAG: hypothetical protein AB1571_03860 [Nanoarchaeota archaeon]
MEENDLEFKNNIKLSFFKVKEHINKLENEINDLKKLLLNQTKEINDLKEKIINLTNKNDLELVLNTKKNDSTGNNGVCANMQTVMQTLVHIPKHINTIKNIEKDINSLFQILTKKEFLVFLTIYQLEDEKQPVTYKLISNYLKLSPGCIRTHITNLIQKGAPIIKSKINNKLTLLAINYDFKALNLKQKLIQIYYQKDPYQTTLTF